MTFTDCTNQATKGKACDRCEYTKALCIKDLINLNEQANWNAVNWDFE